MGDIDSGKPTEGTIDIATATMHQIDAAIANNKLRLEMLERDWNSLNREREFFYLNGYWATDERGRLRQRILELTGARTSKISGTAN